MSTSSKKINLSNLAKVALLSSFLLSAYSVQASIPLNTEDSLKNLWGYNTSKISASLNLLKNKPSQKILVGVIDTGIDTHHTAFSSKLILSQSPSQVTDEHGHGTHISNIIVQSNPQAMILPLKYYSPNNSGSKNLQNTIDSIYQAIQKKVRIINYSGGGSQFSNQEYEALKKAEEAGILVVAAAGNEKSNMDQPAHYFYPAAYALPHAGKRALTNIISVTAVDSSYNVLTSSNWGKKTVDVAAPGNQIYSALPNGRFGYMTGTSQATAFVSGEASLLLSLNPHLTPQQVKRIILESVTSTAELQAKTISGGMINSLKALEMVAKNFSNLNA